MSLLAITLAVLPVSQSAIAEIEKAEQARLNACIELSQEDPDEAYEDSLRWLGEGATPPARYCNAVAIIGKGNYKEGAARLEELANAPDAGGMKDRALYLAQSGNAWLTAGYPDAAVTTLTNAIKLAPEDADVRTDRAAAYFSLEKYEEAIEDLDKSLNIYPNQVDALQLRARSWLKLEELDKAEADMNRAMVIDGKNIDTLVLRGDIREAKRLAGDD
ncbi:tetratricopeptide repeat protein [Henriciella aquimarina]|uniref:tetratricopeptide repeat protein n=1 Tax=Henriciella aquimarina TaxID=545261 RepID=UPI001301B6A4|nr:tetratricopeptide repeat protein [Henriciella aquimarina]